MRSPACLLAAAVLALIACAGRPTPAPAPTPPTTLDAAHLDATLTPHIESYGRIRGERRRFSGFVLVAEHDVPIYARGFEFADREQRRAPTADTSFRTGSVTKQFTGAAIMRLVEDGKLAVDDPIGKHLPEYPAVGAAITVHQLLTHTGGIPSYTAMAEVMEARDQAHTPAELLATFWDRPLEFEPGTRFSYSNSGYAVLGAIIERVSGASYAEFMRTRVFEPAGLTRTVVGDAEGLDDRAIGYQPAGDTLIAAARIDMSVPFSAGAVRSTANDLVRWHRALEDERVVGAASQTRMYTAERDGYAYGWTIGEIDGHPLIGHDGGIDGFSTSYLRVPELDLVVVVWSNNAGVDAPPIATAALKAALGGELAPVDETELIALDVAAAARITGSYGLTEASRKKALELGLPVDVIDTVVTIELRVEHGAMVLAPSGQPPLPLEPLGPARFVQPDHGITVDVTLPAEGTATGITLGQNGLSLEYTRR